MTTEEQLNNLTAEIKKVFLTGSLVTGFQKQEELESEMQTNETLKRQIMNLEKELLLSKNETDKVNRIVQQLEEKIENLNQQLHLQQATHLERIKILEHRIKQLQEHSNLEEPPKHPQKPVGAQESTKQVNVALKIETKPAQQDVPTKQTAVTSGNGSTMQATPKPQPEERSGQHPVPVATLPKPSGPISYSGSSTQERRAEKGTPPAVPSAAKPSVVRPVTSKLATGLNRPTVRPTTARGAQALRAGPAVKYTTDNEKKETLFEVKLKSTGIDLVKK